MGSFSLVTAWTSARRALEAAGIETPIADARLFLQAAAGVTRVDIVSDPHRPISDEARARLDEFVRLRIARKPVAYILGRQGFWTLDLAVTPDVLIPRPDTEAVVHAALPLIKDVTAPRILDLGVGSGAILLALLSERSDAHGVGVDRSAAAIAVARANAATHGLGDRATFREGDWGAGLDDAFDLVVSNPPYIETATIAGLQPEVSAHEPHLALDGGADGLEAYRRLMPDVARLVRPGGGFAFEMGLGQGDAVQALARAHGLTVGGIKVDLTGRDRVVFGSKPIAA